MSQNPARYSVESLGALIFTIRGQRVMLDADLASIYGVQTRRLNEQVRRNAERFPSDFLFQLTQQEAEKHPLSALCFHRARYGKGKSGGPRKQACLAVALSLWEWRRRICDGNL